MSIPAKTRTGGFPIGFRRGGGWQQDLDALITWASANAFTSIDLTGSETLAADITRVNAAGLRVGSVDLCDGRGWSDLLSPDGQRRVETVAAARERIGTCAALGTKIFFTVMLPDDPVLPRRESFSWMVESYAALVPALTAAGARVVIEGWPGPGALCCTPETCRALFRELPDPVMGFNYDPSHLVRMGIDPLRFLREFAGRVYHVHGKDTRLADDDARYEYGHEQPPTFAEPVAYGTPVWRYTIPGHGQTDWSAVLRCLAETGYRGGVSVELEDADFHGGEDAEKRGLLAARQFLEAC